MLFKVPTIYTLKIPIKGLDIKPVRHMKTKYDTRLTDIFLALGYGDKGVYILWNREATHQNLF